MNTVFRTILIDDETSATNALNIIIQEFAPQLQVVGIANSAKVGLDMIHNLNPDLVFVDIQMPHMSGIDLLETIKEPRSFEVIFLTAFNNYAQEAFKLNAISYLLKPIHIPDFLVVIDSFTRKAQLNAQENRKKQLTKVFENKISMPGSEGIEFITISDIIRIEADGSYVKIITTEKKAMLFSKNLKTMEEMLIKHPFLRVHKSHLINVHYVQKYIALKDGGTIIMTDGSEIDLSRTHKEEFIKLYKQT